MLAIDRQDIQQRQCAVGARGVGHRDGEVGAPGGRGLIAGCGAQVEQFSLIDRHDDGWVVHVDDVPALRESLAGRQDERVQAHQLGARGQLHERRRSELASAGLAERDKLDGSRRRRGGGDDTDAHSLPLDLPGTEKCPRGRDDLTVGVQQFNA